MGSGTATLERETVEDTTVKQGTGQFIDRDAGQGSGVSGYGQAAGQDIDMDKIRGQGSAPFGSFVSPGDAGISGSQSSQTADQVALAYKPSEDQVDLDGSGDSDLESDLTSGL